MSRSQAIPPVTHDEIISTITNFHTFLTTHPFLPASSIKTPPLEGWPAEHRETFRRMGKSPQVIDILSHLPYIDSPTWVWFHDTKPINYISPLNQRRISENWDARRYLFEPRGQRLGENVFSLTDGKLYGVWVLLDVEAGMFFVGFLLGTGFVNCMGWLIDVETGTISEYSVYGSPASNVTEEELESDEVWRSFRTTPIGEFFARWIEKMQGEGHLSSDGCKEMHL
ncbi:hypothetical protein LSUB1_G006724 [Lachnellula subtilissima]|uniref:Uncharacterized protein n=1 Tax=Lachnellula subtilissima TaxID=602034 RepID=A0A8H8RFM4_9HELO|nr:hypothetical protein LSUB1_G006724 [Lachnellula subtilissima]